MLGLSAGVADSCALLIPVRVGLVNLPATHSSSPRSVDVGRFIAVVWAAVTGAAGNGGSDACSAARALGLQVGGHRRRLARLLRAHCCTRLALLSCVPTSKLSCSRPLWTRPSPPRLARRCSRLPPLHLSFVHFLTPVRLAALLSCKQACGRRCLSVSPSWWKTLRAMLRP